MRKGFFLLTGSIIEAFTRVLRGEMEQLYRANLMKNSVFIEQLYRVERSLYNVSWKE